jgi:ATP-dependent RNA helicase DDX35
MFTCEEGDHLTLLNVYAAFERSRFDERWCHRNFVSYKNLMRAREITKQLRAQLKRFSVPLVRNDGNPDSILKCIVKGFFANAGTQGCMAFDMLV